MIASGRSSLSSPRNSVFSLIFSGCTTRSPSWCALSFTGDAVNSRPRPRGRSGWVTTSRTWNPVSTSFSSVGTAKRGVPAKTRFMRAWWSTEAARGSADQWARVPQQRSPLAGLHQLANLAFHQIPLQRAEMAHVQLAVEVVGFMEERARQQFLSRRLVKLAVHVLCPDRDLARPGDILAKVWKAEAAFVLRV